jgi:hypothetical protein
MKPLSQSELDLLLAAARDRQRPLELSGYALPGLLLDQQDLVQANFNGSDLSQASLRYANLSQARLVRTCLVGADLTGACLVGADLSWADLTQARLDRARLSEASLAGATLLHTRVRRVDITATKVIGCQVGGQGWSAETLLAWLQSGALPWGLDACLPVQIDSRLYGTALNAETHADTAMRLVPEQAPERYRDRPKGEDARAFLERVWGKYLKCFGAERDWLYQDQLWKLDPELRTGLYGYCRQRQEKVTTYVPPKHARTRAERQHLLIDWRQHTPTRQEIKDLMRVLANLYNDQRRPPR